MEFKWMAIALAVLFFGMSFGLAIEKYSQGQCRVASINKGMTAEDIAKVCK